MPEPVLANSSCLIALEGIGRLELLRELYGEVRVPPAVTREFGLGLPSWMRVYDLTNKPFLEAMLLDLGPGEAETITLAMETPGSLVILDEKKGRKLAERLNLRLTGTLGVLLRAKQRGLVESVREVIQQLDQLNFRMSEQLRRRTLELAGE